MDIMKRFISKQKNCFVTLISLVAISELLLKVNNRIMQSLGILLTPVIAVLVFSLIRNDQKELEK